MPKIKVFKITKSSNYYYYECSSCYHTDDIRDVLLKEVTDWEEVTDKELKEISASIAKHRGNDAYVLVQEVKNVKVDEELGTVEEIKKKLQAEEKKLSQQEKRAAERYKKAEEERAAKKEEAKKKRELKKLKELQEKYKQELK